MEWIFISVMRCIVWGVIVDRMMQNKGYGHKWFLMGFFLGLVGLFIAWTKPEHEEEEVSNGPDPGFDKLSRIGSLTSQNEEWTCVCGRVNSGRTGTCTCGKTKYV